MRRLAFTATTLLLGLALVEGVALVAIKVATDGYQASREHQREIRDSEFSAQPQASRVSRVGADVVHPFLGYVTDPAINERERRRENGRLEVDDQGFFRRGPEPPPVPDAYRVGVFGGSVAFVLSFDARDELESALVRAPDGSQRQVVVESHALGGYKQPQQLMALAWALSLGDRFDVVINLDGFNDIALAVADNHTRGIYPFYPARWSHRIGAHDDPEVVRRIGELRFARSQRVSLAQLFDRPLLRFSPTLLMIWNTLDQRLERRTHELEVAVREVLSTERSFQRFGPEREFDDEQVLLAELAAFWGRSSRQMAALARAHGARYYHFLQPNQYLAGSKPLSAVELKRAFLHESPYIPLVTQGYPLLRSEGQLLADDGIRFHDLSMMFAGDTRDLYVDTCCHLNTEANVEIVRAMAAIMIADEAGGLTRIGE